ncbi:MAG: gliding motility-associated C-terminal domain-containing protein [Saprospiraceae bacterium]|nr:gliding motility-associated C-terminal domain-containing protein [Saprospiraceae bacterium]
MKFSNQLLPQVLSAVGILLFFCSPSEAQNDCKNLLPNPGFEEINGLPDYYTQWFKTKDWNNINLDMISSPGFGSPDFLHVDAVFSGVKLPDSEFGFIFPHTGKAIFHFACWSEGLANFREYLSTKLVEPLVPGNSYDVSFWISNGDMNFGGYGSNSLGVSFSEMPLTQIKAEPLTNAITQWTTPTVLYEPDWHEIKFQFVADKPYQYFSIGGFLDDSEHILTQFEPPAGGFGGAVNYFLDDLSVKKSITEIAIESIGDAAICPGDFIELKTDDFGQSVVWSTGDTTLSIFVNQSGMYTLTSSGNCGTFSDSIEVLELYCETPALIPNAFTPNGDAANDAFGMVPDSNFRVERLLIFNRWGNLVFDSKYGKTTWDGTIDSKPAASDVYVYMIEIRNLVLDSIEKRSGEVTLLR